MVIASQCESLNLLSFLPEAAKDVADALLDEGVGGCVPALADGRHLLVDPTMVQLDDAVTEAFERASEDEATLFIALVGHGDYAEEDFYFLTKDSTDPVNSRNSFLLAQRIKELLGRYSLLDGLVILLDTCHAGMAAQQAATRWIKIVGEAGKRFEVLTASDDRTAADGCFSRSLAKTLRAGSPELGERVRCPDLKRVVSGLCPNQTAVHLAFDGVRTVEKGDQGLWLAMNASDAWQPLRGNPAATEIERLTAGYVAPPELERIIGLLLSGARCVEVTGYGSDALIAALARPAVAAEDIPPKFLHAVLFVKAGQTLEQVATELARQLRRSVKEFGPAELLYLETADVQSQDAFERAVLGPLRTMTAARTAPIRLAFLLAGVIPEDRDRLFGSLRTLTGDRALRGVRTVFVDQIGGTSGLKAAETVYLSALPAAPEPAVWPDYPPESLSDWLDYEEFRTVSPGQYTGSPPPSPQQGAPPSPGDYDLDDEEVPVPAAPLGAVNELLNFAYGSGPLPLNILVAASRRLDGPDRPSKVRDVLAQLGDDVMRIQPGTDAELVQLTTAWYGYLDAPGLPGILADTIEEVAPVSEKDRDTPEHHYARTNHAEYLWLAGRHEDALRSLDDRHSDVPVENRERWKQWSSRVALELGDGEPLTILCRAREATWTGKSGDAAGALAQFEALLPIAETVLAAEDPELLSIRNNVAYQLMDLKRFEEARVAFGALIPETRRALGADDRETIHARHLFAVATGKCGDGDESLRLSWELLPDAERALGEDDEIVGHIQHNIVFWSAHGVAHPPPELLEIYRRILVRTRGRLNDRHPDLLELRFLGTILVAKDGQVGEALAEWTVQLEQSIDVLGERHDHVAKIREQLEFWGSAG
ncbi:MAG: phosphopeptide-binding protein [Amycolatopsis sp.]|nr:phosphopeptide-binding protein [Amycolatopsis sp.]